MICKRLFIFALLVLALVLPVAVPAADVGEAAPDFTLQTLDGQEVSLADFRGQVVILKLATSWCPTCKELAGELAGLAEYFKERNVVVLEVFVQDTEAMIRDAMAGKSFPGVHHALLDDGSAYRAYSVYLIPRMVVIDAEQVVRYDSVGRTVSGAEIRKMVDDLGPAAAGS